MSNITDNPLDQKYLVADTRNPEEMRVLSERIAEWEPRLSVTYENTDRLYASEQTLYVMLMTSETTLCQGGREEQIKAGDMAVIAPKVEIKADKLSEFLVFAYDGLTPPNFAKGYEIFLYRESGASESRCGIKRCEILPSKYLARGYRLAMHFVEIQNPGLHLHEDMVEFYYVLYGEGDIGLGDEVNNLESIPVRPGSVIAVGNNLYHPPSDGLGMSIFFLYRQADFEAKSVPKK